MIQQQGLPAVFPEYKGLILTSSELFPAVINEEGIKEKGTSTNKEHR